MQDERIMLVTELMEAGDLWHALMQYRESGALSWYRRGKRIALEIARGLHFLHRHKIIHFVSRHASSETKKPLMHIGIISNDLSLTPRQLHASLQLHVASKLNIDQPSLSRSVKWDIDKWRELCAMCQVIRNCTCRLVCYVYSQAYQVVFAPSAGGISAAKCYSLTQQDKFLKFLVHAGPEECKCAFNHRWGSQN